MFYIDFVVIPIIPLNIKSSINSKSSTKTFGPQI